MPANSTTFSKQTPPQSRTLMARRIVQLLVGLFLYGIGIAFLVRSDLGAAPWDVLTQGLSHHIPLTFGTITVIISGVVLLLWIPLRQKLGIGTVLNSFLVGPSADAGFFLIPELDTLWIRISFIAIGIIVIGLATGLYVGSRFGPGPRDGLMMGLNKTTGRPIWQVRVALELVVVAIGWILGGTVGIGTIAFAVLIGYACQLFLEMFSITLPSDDELNKIASIEVEHGQVDVLDSPA